MLNGAEMAVGEDGEASFDVDQGRARLMSPPPHCTFNKVRHVQAQFVLTTSSSLPLRRLMSATVKTTLVSLRQSLGPHMRLDAPRSTAHILYPPQHSQTFGVSIRGLRYLLPARDGAMAS
jgi:hypothetical protein